MNIKERIFKNKWFVLVIVLIALGFYWYELRPMQIRQDCQELARVRGNEFFLNEPIQKLEPLQRGREQLEYITGFYDRCLHDNGI